MRRVAASVVAVGRRNEFVAIAIAPKKKFHHTTTHFAMSFPGMMPPMGGLGASPGNGTQGMNDQEQAMVKMVSVW